MLVLLSDSPRRLEYTVRSKFNAELIKLENVVVDVQDLLEKVSGKIVLLRIHSMYKLYPLAQIVSRKCRKLINSLKLVEATLNREKLYSILESVGLDVPKRYYVFDLCNVSDVKDKVRGRTLLLTFTKSEIEGFVESPQALVSLIEHRYYMSAEDVKVNMFIPMLEECEDVLVIGQEALTGSGESRQLVKKVIDVFGDGIYTVKVCRQERRKVVVDVDPCPEVSEDEHIEKIIQYLQEQLRS